MDQLLGEGRAIRLSFNSSERQGCAEGWFATLVELSWPDDGPPDERVLAAATLVRVDLNDSDWLDSLDAESGDLLEVGLAFRDREAVAELDEESLFADSLLVIDHVSVVELDRGSGLSHRFLRGIAAIFRNDLVALIPDGNSVDDGGRVVEDQLKRARLSRHWIEGGFQRIPDTEVLMLPFTARAAY